MAAIPKNDENTTHFKINEGEIVSELRPYCGMSGIGEKCFRKLQYLHYWAFRKTFSRRMERIFNTGHAAEEFIVADLKRIGVECRNVLKDQLEIVGFAGHWKGHPDGFGIGIPEAPKTEHLLEFKTMAEKYFNKCVKEGVQKSNPKYYSQMQRYMEATDKTRALFVAYNKNTSEYYFERVKFDQDHASELKVKEQRILMAEELFEKIGGPSWFECKFCNAYDVCHGGHPYEKNCRTCRNVDICDGGKWECTEFKKELTIQDQRDGKDCPVYELAEIFKNG